MNRNLKTIAGFSKVSKLTFIWAYIATTVTLMKGVPIESISKMLRNTKITTTMICARVNQPKVEKEKQAFV